LCSKFHSLIFHVEGGDNSGPFAGSARYRLRCFCSRTSQLHCSHAFRALTNQETAEEKKPSSEGEEEASDEDEAEEEDDDEEPRLKYQRVGVAVSEILVHDSIAVVKPHDKFFVRPFPPPPP
jgi:hypothetical protein